MWVMFLNLKDPDSDISRSVLDKKDTLSTHLTFGLFWPMAMLVYTALVIRNNIYKLDHTLDKLRYVFNKIIDLLTFRKGIN